MKTYNTLDELYSDAGSQITAQELINGRCYLKDVGYTDIDLSDELFDFICTDISERLGGRSNTKENVRFALKFRKPQHWGLCRFILQKYSGKAFLGYVAGQDQVWESREIRNKLKNLY